MNGDARGKTPTSKYVGVCHRCGSPLTAPQVALKVTGQYIKFDEREVGQIDLYECRGCMEASLKFAEEGIRGAVERMEHANEMIRVIDMEAPMPAGGPYEN